MLYPLLRQAASKFKDAKYQAFMAKIPGVAADDRSNLLQPNINHSMRAER